MSTSWSAGVSTSRTNKHTGYAGWLHAHIYTHCWSLFLYLAYGRNNAPINNMPHYPPPGQCQGRSGDLNYAKFKCTTYWACQSVKAQSSFHLKHGELREDLLVNVHTSVHAYDHWYDELSNSPRMTPEGYKIFQISSKLWWVGQYQSVWFRITPQHLIIQIPHSKANRFHQGTDWSLQGQHQKHAQLPC